jgi:DNA adenine methylase
MRRKPRVKVLAPDPRRRIRPPFPYYGGKTHHAARIAAALPEHRTYVEVFGGSAAVLLAKPPSPVEVYNDVDDGVVGFFRVLFFRVLRDPEAFARLRRRLRLTPYARAERVAGERWRDEPDPVERAALWFVLARGSFSGRVGSAGWSASVGHSGRGMSAAVSAHLGAVDRLPEVAARLLRVQVERADWRDVLARYDRPRTAFYLDPPYPHATRGGDRYDNELTAADHADLVRALLRLRGRAVLSTYFVEELHRPLVDAGWTRTDLEVAAHAGKRVGGRGRGRRTETLLASRRWRPRRKRLADPG